MSHASIRRSLRVVLSTVSPLGWMVLGIGVSSWTAGSLLGWRELLVIASTSLLLMLIAIGFTVGQLDLSSSLSVAPSRVVAGERAAGELKLRNNRARSAHNLRLEMPVGKVVAVFAVPVLKGGEETNELFVVPTRWRAVIPVGPVATVQGDPLGLLHRHQIWSNIDEIFVHPKTTPVGSIAAGLIRDMEGRSTNKLSSSDIAFHTLRDYVPGDDRRHVHWKSSAKLGKLLVRQYVDTRRSHVAVLLSTDLDDYSTNEEFELSVSCAASVALQAIREEQTLTVITGGEQLTTVNPKLMLDAFSAIVGVSGRGGVDACMRSARALAADASVAIVCTGSTPAIPIIHKAMSRLTGEIHAVVFRAALGSKSSYRLVGSSMFMNIPGLETLGRGVRAVTV